MKINKRKILSNLFWVVLLTLIIIPKSRQFIQVAFHKLIGNISSVNIIDSSERVAISDLSWKLIDENNEVFNLNFEEENVILINFWATWCPPCIAEMPSLQNLYDKHKDEVVFLFVTNDNRSTINSFMEKHNYTFKVYNTVNTIPDELFTKSIPRTFILNKKGEIIVDESGALDWNSSDIHQLLRSLLKE